jgi:uncharacterized iron-regulated membrane protein
MKKRLWKIHSWLGLIAGMGLLVIGLTGSLLVFRNELEALVNADYVRVETKGERQPLDRLMRAVEKTLPNHEITGWLIPRETEYSDVVYVTRHGESISRIAFVNPRTGEVRGGKQEWNHTVTGWLLDLHYSFFSGHFGILVSGILAVMLCLLGVSGFWLYRGFWKNFCRLRWRASSRIFFSDVHKLTGISSMVFNLILGFTGAYWNLPHAYAHFVNGGDEEPKIERTFYNRDLSLDDLITRAAERIPGFQAAYLNLPVQPEADVVIYGAVSANPFQSDYGSSVAFDAKTGALKSALDIRRTDTWTKITDAFFPLHYGTFGGWPVKILWCAGGLTPGILAVSGFLIWWKRRQNQVPVRLMKNSNVNVSCTES